MAQAPAIPGTLRLYKEAQRLGVSIIFHYRPERNAARRNGAQSARAGLRQLETACDAPQNHGSQTIGAFKAVARGQIAGAGYTLALNVGDQWSDLKGKPEAEYSVKYPDPYYFIP